MFNRQAIAALALALGSCSVCLVSWLVIRCFPWNSPVLALGVPAAGFTISLAAAYVGYQANLFRTNFASSLYFYFALAGMIGNFGLFCLAGALESIRWLFKDY